MQIIIFFSPPEGATGIEPATAGSAIPRSTTELHARSMIVRRQEEKKNIYLVSLPEVGFEPTHPKITELKSAALDHSAIQALEHKEENKEKK